MNYNSIANLISSPWHIDAVALHQYLPIFRATLTGLNFDKANEPDENKNYFISCTSQVKTNTLTNSTVSVDGQESNEKFIHVLPINGVMFRNDIDCGPRGTKTLAKRLLSADNDDDVIGHIIHFDTPGGQGTAPQELLEVYPKLTKPVVNFIEPRGLCCSAGMYALGPHHTIAGSDDARVGSIGTMIVYSGRKSKSEANLLGEIEVTIYASKSNKKNEAYEKAINDFDFSVARKKILDPFNEVFHQTMIKNRPGITENELTGEDFPASECVGTLVDEINDFQAAIDKVIELSNQQSTMSEVEESTINNQQTTINQQSNTMNLPLLCAALGIASLETQDGYASLNEEQLQALEAALDTSDLTSQIDSLTSERDQAQTDLNSAQTERDQLQTDLDQANQQIDQLQNDAGETSSTITSSKEVVSETSASDDEKEMAKLADMTTAERLAYLKSQK